MKTNKEKPNFDLLHISNVNTLRSSFKKYQKSMIRYYSELYISDDGHVCMVSGANDRYQNACNEFNNAMDNYTNNEIWIANEKKKYEEGSERING